MEPQIRNLTDRQVESVKAANGHRIDFRDAKRPGLVLRVSPAGVKAWSVLYRRRIDGRRRRCTLGQYPQVSLAEARAKALDVLARVARGEDPAGDQRRKRTSGTPRTFGELADLYLARHADRAKRSGFQDRQMLDKDVLPILRHEPLESIKRADISEIIETIVARGAPIQANRTFEIIRGVFNWGLGAGCIETTPCLGLRAPTPEQSRDRALKPDEIRQFWNRLPDAPMSWRTAQILRLCFVTAQRVSEVAGISRSEISLSERLWRLPAERVKNASAHDVPLSALAIELLEQGMQRSDGDLIFPSHLTAEPITNHAVAKAMRRSLETFGLERFTAHDLRRTAATEMAGLGIDRLIVDKVLNHVSADRSTVAGVYDRHAYRAQKAAALEAWADHLRSIIGTEPSRGAN